MFETAYDVEGILQFKNSEYLYKAIDKDDDIYKHSSINLIYILAGGKNVYYANKNEMLYEFKNSREQVTYLISYKPQKWKITKETKTILGYTCFKAVEVNANKKDYHLTEVWFTKQLPVTKGPYDFSGLPGAMLEITNYKSHYLAKEIILKPKELIKIYKPTKGIKITREAYNERYKSVFKRN